MIGRSLGHYQVVELLGAGGMGEVYRAHDTTLGRDVALKVLPEDLAADPERLSRLKREAKLLASLNHAHIATIHSLEEADGVRFLVLELVEGRTLAERLALGRLEVREALDIAGQITEALGAAHGSGIIHRDLKPANVMVTTEGQVKVLDFGLAKPSGEEGSDPEEELSHSPTATVAATRAGVLLGTAPYMSPEQARGTPADRRSDIWAFGCLLYEMLSGRRPFGGDTVSDTLAAILATDPEWEALPSGMPEGLRTLLQRCLQKDPGQRYHDIADVRIEIQEVRAGGALAPGTSSRSLRWALMGAGLLLVVVVGWLGWTGAFGGSDVDRLDPDLLVVLPFQNQTGDPSLDDLGRLAASDVSEGIAETDSVRVASLRDEARPLDEATMQAGLTSLLALAREAGAATALSCEFYLRDGILEFRTRLLDVGREEIIFAAEPVRVPMDEREELLEVLRQRTMGMVALQFGIERTSPLADYLQRTMGTPSEWSKIPDYDAYREYLSGMELFYTDRSRALAHFQRAVELDPAFFPPLFFCQSIYRGMRRWEEVELIVSESEQRLGQLSPFERTLVGGARAQLDGDMVEFRRQVALGYEMVPAMDPARHVIEQISLSLNEPARVVAAYSNWDRTEIEELGLSPGTWISANLTAAHHLLGDYDAEMREARRTLGYYPSFLTVREAEVRALAALGRVEEIRSAIDASLTVRSQAGTPDRVMMTAAEELRAHGNPGAGQEIADRAVVWVRDLPPAEQSPARLARALFVAELWEEARALFRELADQRPDSIEYLGTLGVLAARLGDEESARRISDELRAIDRPYVYGSHTYWQAAIAAVLGEQDRAVNLIREWISQAAGVDYVALHCDPNFSSLWGYPPFQEILRPKG